MDERRARLTTAAKIFDLPPNTLDFTRVKELHRVHILAGMYLIYVALTAARMNKAIDRKFTLSVLR